MWRTDGAHAVRALADVCRPLVRFTACDGASVALISNAAHDLLYATDEVALALDDLQFATGHGPCFDALRTGSPVLVDDVAREADSRWPGFSGDATRIGVGSIVAVPLSAARAPIGVLELHREGAGALTARQLDAVDHCAAEIARTLLEMVARSESGDPGFPRLRPHVDMAVGMIMVQLSVSPDEALSRLRAAAYAARRPVEDLAVEVTERRARFHRGQDTSDSTGG